ncbi:MAG: indole-3-glycerol phosphate synthase TrpC [Gemmatimonadaceae bacterium]
MPETQALSVSGRPWIPPTGTLGGLVAAAYARAAAQGGEASSWREKAESAAAVPSFRKALRRDDIAVIAELKRRSPSKGSINLDLDAAAQAQAYARAGAAALSVLTEPERFGGSTEDLSTVTTLVDIPVLRKDFIVASVQLYEARARGASAALLIVRALPHTALVELHDIGQSIGLDLLVEIRDETELAIALDIGASVIGVNNRNLETLAIDPTTVSRMMPQIPREIIGVAESGMASRSDVAGAAAAGADAVLVGSFVSASADPCAAVKSLTGISVERNARRD